MYLTYEGKSEVAERFIRTLKAYETYIWEL